MYGYNVLVQVGMSDSLESIGRYFNICIYLLLLVPVHYHLATAFFHIT